MKYSGTQPEMLDEWLSLKSELVGMLYDSNSKSLAAAIAVATTLLLIQRNYIKTELLLIWCAVFVFAYLTRTLVSLAYKKSQYKTEHANRWMNYFRITTALCGSAWGLAGVLLYPVSDTAHQAFLIFALVGVAGGAIIVYSVDALCSNLFVGFLLLLTVPRFIINGSSFSITIALLLIIFVIYVTVAGQKLAKNLHENIRLRITAILDSKEMHRLAFYDFLTNLPNRRLLSKQLNKVFANCKKTSSFGAVYYINLNNFKSLNDTKGHSAGDRLLQLVAQRMQKELRDKDVLARVGGDEFVVAVDDLGSEKLTATNACQAFAEKLIQAMNEPFKIDDFKYNCLTSIGICLFYGQEFDEAEVLRRADVAMYQAKKLKQHKSFKFYDEELNPTLQLRATIVNDLRLALDGNQFLPYYQAQVDQNKAVFGVELLLRWKHPELGFISPLEFIPIAEETGMILPIGDWVITKACEQIKAWEGAANTNRIRISVNVSALQFNQPDFVEKVIATINRIGCNPNLLRLEITESTVLENIELIIEKMLALKKAGISFALDDFGTGQSSLSVIKRLPLDELKIDRSFISDISHESNDTFMVQTIISIAKNLGLEVIAEGVEMDDQQRLLRKYGCNNFQGFLYGKPVSIKDLKLDAEDAI
jgi:diguanylate cyclase (GGDEF)-like protein